MGRRRWPSLEQPAQPAVPAYAVSRLKAEGTRLSIHCHPEAAAAAPPTAVVAKIKRRGGGRRRAPQLQAGKGGWIPLVCDTRPSAHPSPQVGSGSFGVLRRDV